MQTQSLSPVLFVDAIEPSLPFWTERLGFEVHAQVDDDGGRLQFVLLLNGRVTVMLQTLRSLDDDLPMLDDRDRATRVCLYVKVDDLDATIAALGDWPILVPRRTTFYGADEIGVRGPAGNVVLLSQTGSP